MLPNQLCGTEIDLPADKVVVVNCTTNQHQMTSIDRAPLPFVLGRVIVF